MSTNYFTAALTAAVLSVAGLLTICAAVLSLSGEGRVFGDFGTADSLALLLGGFLLLGAGDALSLLRATALDAEETRKATQEQCQKLTEILRRTDPPTPPPIATPTKIASPPPPRSATSASVARYGKGNWQR